MVTCLTGDSISLILDAFCQYSGFLELYFQGIALFSKNSLKNCLPLHFQLRGPELSYHQILITSMLTGSGYFALLLLLFYSIILALNHFCIFKLSFLGRIQVL